MRSRRTSEEERLLFEQDFKEARPIRPVTAKAAAKKAKATRPSGVNGATQEKLRKGLIEPDARLDLHGMTQTAAHRALRAWLAAAQARGVRLALVVTGKGNPKNAEDAPWMAPPHGVLKAMVPRWLNEADLAALIAHVRPAHAKHGGGGALYVYLRKNR